MDRGRGGGDEGDGWKVVSKRSQKREASSERPDLSEAVGEKKIMKMSSEEFVVLFRVKDQKQGGESYYCLG